MTFIGTMLSGLSRGGAPVSAPPADLQTDKPRPVLMLMGFESNSGGMDDSSTLPIGDRLSNPDVQLFNVTNFHEFNNLHIGVNNNLDHTGLTPMAMVGWHTQLGRRMKAGTFVDSPLYLCELGQGGSRVQDWDNGDLYYEKAKARVDAAIDVIKRDTGRPPEIYFMFTFGINDAINGTPAATFKTGALDLMNRLRTRYGNFPVFVTELMPDSIITSAGYPAIISSLVADMGNAYLIPSGSYPLMNANHWNHTGYAMIVDWVADKILALRA